MWRLKWVHPLNFGPFGDTTERLDLSSNLLLILGQNFDNSSGISNGCLVGDTLIDCPRDLRKYPKGIPIKELVGQQPWVYAWKDGNIVVRKALSVWRTKEKTEIVRAQLKSTSAGRPSCPPCELVGTPDHLVLLSDGKTWKALGQLTKGDRLCSLYRQTQTRSNTSKRQHAESVLLWTGSDGYVREHRFIAEQVYGLPEKGFHAHHIDQNPLNQVPENLEWKYGYKHVKDHHDELGPIMHRPGVRERWIHPKGHLGHRHTEETKKCISNTLLRKNFEKKKLQQEAAINHVVSSVEFARYDDVYDMTVPDAESFIANGVVVHNSGKSSVLRSILYVLIGRTELKGVSASGVIRDEDGVDWCSVALCLDNGEDELIIRRGRKPSGPFLEVEINGDSSKNPRTNDQRQEYLMKILGIASGDLGMDLIMNTTMITSEWEGFASKSTTSSERFSIVSSILDQEIYTEAAEKARKRLKILQTEVVLLKGKVEVYRGLAGEFDDPDVLLDQLEGETKENKSLLAVAEESRDGYLSATALVNQQLGSIDKKRQALNSQYTLLGKTRNDHTAVLAKLKSMDTERADLDKCGDSLEARIKPLEVDATKAEELKSGNENAIIGMKSEVAKIEREKALLKKQAKNPTFCPSCTAPLVATRVDPLSLEVLDMKAQENLEKTLGSLESNRVFTTAQILKLEKSNQEYNSVINEFKGVLTELNAVGRKIDGLEANKELLEKQDTSLTSSTIMLEAQIKEAERNIPDVANLEIQKEQLAKDMSRITAKICDLLTQGKELSSHRQRLEACIKAKKALSEVQAQIGAKQVEEDSLNFWTKAFPDIRGKLMDEFTPELEDLTNEYFSTIGSPMEVRLSTTSITQKGNEVPEFNLDVLDDVGKSRDIRLLSKGERTRTRLCMAPAFGEILRSRGKINFDFILLDEVTDGLDKVGLEKMLDLYTGLGRQIIIVSHDDTLKERIFDSVVVQKSGGISKFLLTSSA